MDPLLATALEAAEAAARIHIRHFREVGPERAWEKARSDFVSQVDLEAQAAALAVIRSRCPDHEILAEEDDGNGAGGGGEAGIEGSVSGGGGRGRGSRGMEPKPGGYVWMVDPLDGTTNYLHGHPQFAASVGVGRRPATGEGGAPGSGEILLEAGAVVAPRTGERWWARAGGGAFKNGKRIKVSSIRSMRTALIGTGFPFKEPHLVQRYMEQFQRVLPNSGGIRRAGSAAMDLCFLAEGIFDGFWEEDYLSPWDVAAGVVILREAGGVATHLDGSEIGLENGSVLAANSTELYQALAGLVNGG